MELVKGLEDKFNSLDLSIDYYKDTAKRNILKIYVERELFTYMLKNKKLEKQKIRLFHSQYCYKNIVIDVAVDMEKLIFFRLEFDNEEVYDNLCTELVSEQKPKRGRKKKIIKPDENQITFEEHIGQVEDKTIEVVEPSVENKTTEQVNNIDIDEIRQKEREKVLKEINDNYNLIKKPKLSNADTKQDLDISNTPDTFNEFCNVIDNCMNQHCEFICDNIKTEISSPEEVAKLIYNVKLSIEKLVFVQMGYKYLREVPKERYIEFINKFNEFTESYFNHPIINEKEML